MDDAFQRVLDGCDHMPVDPSVPGEAMDDLLRDEQQTWGLDLDPLVIQQHFTSTALQVQHLQ